MSKKATVSIEYKEIQKAIREYVEKKYGVSTISSTIHLSMDMFGDMNIDGATVTYELQPKD